MTAENSPAFLTQLRLQDDDWPDGYPFNVPAIEALPTLTFDSNVTFLVGENGCGKSSLIEAIACSLKCPAIGGADVMRDPLLAPARELASRMRLSKKKNPRRKLFFRAEDAIGFTRKLQADLEELAGYEEEYSKTLSGYGRQLATGAMQGQQAGITSRYGDNPDARSHGEWFLNVARERIHGEGLFLLDEPETPLSPIHQLTLLSIIKETVAAGGQFIIATHSPVLMAYPGATILAMDEIPPRPVAWDDVEHVAILKAFLANPQAYLRHL